MLGCFARLIATIRTLWRTMRPLPNLTVSTAGLLVPPIFNAFRLTPPPARPRQKDYG